MKPGLQEITESGPGLSAGVRSFRRLTGYREFFVALPLRQVLFLSAYNSIWSNQGTHFSKNGNNRFSSALFGCCPYSQISNASAYCTLAPCSDPYQSFN